MTSKVVSGMGGAPSGLLKSGTNFASKSGKDWVSYGGRRAALDPALTFLAQLNRDTQDDLGAADTFTRESDGLYLPYNGADWRIASDNVPRFENGRLLKEPAATNVFLNSASAATQSINLPLGEHTLSVHGSGSITSSDNGGVATGHGTATDGNPVAINVTTAGNILFTVSGSPTYAQVESGRVPTSPIITQGAAGVRAADALLWAGASGFFNQAQGMAILTWRPRFNKADQTLTDSLISITNATRQSILYYDGTGLKSNDDTSVVSVATPAFAASDELRVATLFGPGATGSRQVGYSWNGGAWVWSTAGNYDGDFQISGFMYLNYLNRVPSLFSDLRVYDENRGSAWVEANYP